MLLDAHRRLTDGIEGEECDVWIYIEGLAIGLLLQLADQNAAILLHGLLEFAQNAEMEARCEQLAATMPRLATIRQQAQPEPGTY